MPGTARCAACTRSSIEASFCGTGMPLNGPAISESWPNCQIFRITSAQVLMTPVKPTTNIHAAVTMPEKIVQVEPAYTRRPVVPHRAELELPHRRRIDHDAGDDRDDEQKAHQPEEQLARQAGEHVDVQLEQDVRQPAP